ncbi:MAG TPA: UDP-galactopyranose mutase [Coriobacteriia bacterium]|nr:UDP-galactopyranose mutase [Coriobacteriia bacterium]
MNITDVKSDPSFTFDATAYDTIVVGAGFAGAVAARELAERKGSRVAVIERRPHIAGNTYDHLDKQGVLIHEYGPHIYHTVHERVHNYLSRFTEWRDYRHEVLAFIRGEYIPVPFNLNSIEMTYDAEKAAKLNDLLVSTFGIGTKVPIIDLRKQDEPLLKELAEYVYENVFLYYTQKQWDLTPEQIDPAVTARVPVLVDRDNRYFTDTFQGMPQDGYLSLFENLLDFPGIDVFVNLDARSLMSFEQSGDGESYQAILINGRRFEGTVIYTGALDDLTGEAFGLLPYRSIDFEYDYYDTKRVQPCGTVNFTVSEDYTRTTEYTWLTGQDIEVTTVAREYSSAFTDPATQTPYYPIFSGENQAYYDRYRDLFKDLPNFHPLGRLAEYRYYNMDQIVLRALELIDELV